MNEHEYEQWFEMYLGDVESPYSEYSELSPFKNIPKPLKKKIWLWVLLISLIILILSSLLFSFLYSICNHWYLDWISNALLSFLIGIVSSVLILIYTNSAEKNISFYSDVIPLLEERYSKMSAAYYDCALYPNIRYGENNMQGCFNEWHKLINTCTVILDFIKFLSECSPEYKNRLSIDIDTLNRYSQELSEANEKISKEFYSINEINHNTLEDGLKITYCGSLGLSAIENMIVKMKQELYRNKYTPK